ncbi:uncharacterized protein EAF02_007856 [Botrytis sinoallii]|uniref:uncharacterized protein n=1 Tax=Botrytis sinoallii TaxID=1463999 RepID=UPI0018FF4E6C|nr:uncharacterized protein EAF02_007856 [Botrytis sinoallii]KAF7879686.1 hypothetical protein EAF02_007856 [Botrytis sinoallii]
MFYTEVCELHEANNITKGGKYAIPEFRVELVVPCHNSGKWALIGDTEWDNSTLVREARRFLAIPKTEFVFSYDTLLRKAVEQLDVALEEVAKREIPMAMGSSNGIKAGKCTGILSDDRLWLSYQGRITQQCKGKDIDRKHVVAELPPPKMPKEHCNIYGPAQRVEINHLDHAPPASPQISLDSRSFHDCQIVATKSKLPLPKLSCSAHLSLLGMQTLTSLMKSQ